MVLTVDHAAKAGEFAFLHVGVPTVVAVAFRVVHTVNVLPVWISLLVRGRGP
jgi:hypothetical protein